MDQTEEGATQTALFQHQSLEDSLTSLYSPPYGSKKPASPEPKNELPPRPKKVEPPTRAIPELKSPFAQREGRAFEEEEDAFEAPAKEKEPPAKIGIFSIILMLLGGNIFTLGLMQFFFSEKNTLRLEWNTGNWYLYCLVAVPFLFVGYRLASKLKA